MCIVHLREISNVSELTCQTQDISQLQDDNQRPSNPPCKNSK